MKKKSMLFGFIIVFVLFLLYIFMPEGILLEPLITPQEYLDTKPFIEIFNKWIIIVPSSTIIVYLLGIQITYLGYSLIKDKQKLWGISLLFWGLGTILAGTSYQGLGYELKCNVQTYCLFTSWFELAYLFVTAISISIMAIAFAEMFAKDKVKRYLSGYGKIAIIVYTFILLLGSILENELMISYELFTVFFMPLFVVFFVINIINYKKDRSRLDKTFIILWIAFLVVNLSYYVYYFLGFTSNIYEQTGIWFSANDVLHIGLILWFLYFQFKVIRELKIRKTN
jgi:hypothetical protein